MTLPWISNSLETNEREFGQLSGPRDETDMNIDELLKVVGEKKVQ